LKNESPNSDAGKVKKDIMGINRIGITGLGIMGRGIAEICLGAGYQVTVSEKNEEILYTGLESLKSTLKRLTRIKRFPEEILDNLPEKLTGITQISDFKNCDLIIEAIPENLEAKKSLFKSLDHICPAHTILATNTSCLPVTEIGSLANRPEKIVGIHFFNPVNLMKLVEIIKTEHTSPETLQVSSDFVESLGKKVVIAPDTPGFIVNRLLLAFLSEAMRLHEIGVSTEDIDKAITLGLNHPMGPFKLADFIGLDTSCYIAESMKEQLDAPHFSPPAILKQMVAEGKLGRKTGEGFYRY